MSVVVYSSWPAVYEFACHSAACRPPTSGGTGGSTKGGKEGLPSNSGTTGVDIRDAAATVVGGNGVVCHAKDVDDMMELFGDADGPVDLTLVDVAGEPSLYNAMRENGIPRGDMPQIPKENLDAFVEDLQKRGASLRPERVDPAVLKPTQSELDGRNSGRMLRSMRDGTMDLDGDPIWVSSDGHILDGHHRWAAASAISADCGHCLTIPVIRTSFTINELLSTARDFNRRSGIRSKGFGASAATTKEKRMGKKKFRMATDEADGVKDEDLKDLPHGDGSAFDTVPPPPYTGKVSDEFACHDASCRPPTAGGTGGSSLGGHPYVPDSDAPVRPGRKPKGPLTSKFFRMTNTGDIVGAHGKQFVTVKGGVRFQAGEALLRYLSQFSPKAARA